jgi:glycosyltransferase involved in cell wall biosynthesis
MTISVVIRAKNEAIRLGLCWQAVALQRADDVEVILVDNASTDGTPELARQWGWALVELSDADFSYGRALNRGIARAKGEIVALLSGHCVPVNDLWLRRLASNFQDPRVAGVYGRQEPLPDSHDFDKRDLWTTFGVERRVQRKDYFFHNANSMIRRSVWERMPFDESLNGVEDRAWAKQVIEAGWSLVYEPAASVYHHHGIHQGRDERRARRVVRVIEHIQGTARPDAESR